MPVSTVTYVAGGTFLFGSSCSLAVAVHKTAVVALNLITQILCGTALDERIINWPSQLVEVLSLYPAFFAFSVYVLLAVRPRRHTGDTSKGAREVCQVRVAQPVRDIGHFQAGRLQHLTGRMVTRKSQQLGIMGAYFIELTLQSTLAGIAHAGNELYAEIELPTVGQHNLLECADKIIGQGPVVER